MTEILESREYVVENLTKEKKSGEESLDVYGSQSADVRLLAYKFLIENFTWHDTLHVLCFVDMGRSSMLHQICALLCIDLVWHHP